jgi:hypothetical protein
MNKVVLNILCISFLSLNAFADKVRNGGNYVVCSMYEVLPYFYDYYDLKYLKKVNPNIPRKTNDAFIAAQIIIDRQFEIDRAFKNRLTNYLIEMKNSFLDSDTELIELNDHPKFILPKGCKFYQAAISGPDDNSNKWVYDVYGVAWNNMDTENQVSLILHEIIYHIASDLGQRTSAKTILINQALLTSGIGLSEPKYLFELRKKLNLILPEEF